MAKTKVLHKIQTPKFGLSVDCQIKQKYFLALLICSCHSLSICTDGLEVYSQVQNLLLSQNLPQYNVATIHLPSTQQCRF